MNIYTKQKYIGLLIIISMSLSGINPGTSANNATDETKELGYNTKPIEEKQINDYSSFIDVDASSEGVKNLFLIKVILDESLRIKPFNNGYKGNVKISPKIKFEDFIIKQNLFSFNIYVIDSIQYGVKERTLVLKKTIGIDTQDKNSLQFFDFGSRTAKMKLLINKLANLPADSSYILKSVDFAFSITLDLQFSYKISKDTISISRYGISNSYVKLLISVYTLPILIILAQRYELLKTIPKKILQSTSKTIEFGIKNLSIIKTQSYFEVNFTIYLDFVDKFNSKWINMKLFIDFALEIKYKNYETGGYDLTLTGKVTYGYQFSISFQPIFKGYTLSNEYIQIYNLYSISNTKLSKATIRFQPYGKSGVKEDYNGISYSTKIKFIIKLTRNDKPISGTGIDIQFSRNGKIKKTIYNIAVTSSGTYIGYISRYQLYPGKYQISIYDKYNKLIGNDELEIYKTSSYYSPKPIVEVTGYDPYKSTGSIQSLKFSLKNIGSENSGGGSGLHLSSRDAIITGISSSEFQGIIFLGKFDYNTNKFVEVKKYFGSSTLSFTGKNYNVIELYGEVPQGFKVDVVINIKSSVKNPNLEYRAWLGDPTNYVYTERDHDYLTKWIRYPVDTTHQTFVYFHDIKSLLVKTTIEKPNPVKIKYSYATNEDKAYLIWEKYDNSAGPLKYYIVQESTNPKFSTFKSYYIKNSNSFTSPTTKGVAGEIRNYYYRVLVATTKGEYSDTSKYVEVIIDREDEKTVNKPVMKSLGTIKTDSFTVSWIQPKYLTTGRTYSCSYNIEVSDPNNIIKNYYTDRYYYTLTNAFNGVYKIKVRAYCNGKAVSDYSNSMSVTVNKYIPSTDIVIGNPLFTIKNINNQPYVELTLNEVRRSDKSTMITYANVAKFNIVSMEGVIVYTGTLVYKHSSNINDKKESWQYIGYVTLPDIGRYYLQIEFDDGYATGKQIFKDKISSVSNYIKDTEYSSNNNPIDGTKVKLIDINSDGIFERVYFKNNILHLLDLSGKDINGWPKVLKYSDNNINYDVADLNNDGILEIIVIAVNTITNTRDIYVYYTNGSLINSFPQTFSTTNSGYNSYILRDINNDGMIDIIFATHSNDIVNIHAIDYQGVDNLSGLQITGMTTSSVEALYYTDFNKDNVNELLVITSIAIFSINPSSKSIIAQYNLPSNRYIVDGSILFDDYNMNGNLDLIASLRVEGYKNKELLILESSLSWVSSALIYQLGQDITVSSIANLDIDANMELIGYKIVNNEYFYNGLYTVDKYIIYKIDITSSTAFSITELTDSYKGLPTPYDTDQNGIHELIFPNSGIINNQGIVQKNSILLIGYTSRDPIFSDINNDGSLEILIGTDIYYLNDKFNPLLISYSVSQLYSIRIDQRDLHISWNPNLLNGKFLTVNAFIHDNLGLITIYEISANGVVKYSSYKNVYQELISVLLELKAGSNTISINVTDSFGNSRIISKIITVESDAPVMLSFSSPLIIYPNVTKVDAEKINVNIVFSDATGVYDIAKVEYNNKTYYYTLNTNILDFSLNIEYGEQRLKIIVSDILGNEITYVFLVKRTEPNLAPDVIYSITSNNSINIVWYSPTSNIEDLIGFEIYRRVKGTEEFTILGSTIYPFYIDIDITQKVEYEYSIVSLYDGGKSDKSTIVTGIVYNPPISFAKAVNNINVSKVGNHYVTLNWSINENTSTTPITSYRIYRRENNSNDNFSLYGLIVAENTLEFTDDNVINGEMYYYVVVAVNSFGEGYWALPVEAIPNAIGSVPEKVKIDNINFVEDEDVGNYIQINWTKPSEGESKIIYYNIYRKINNNTDFEFRGSVVDNVYIDMDIDLNTIYFYKVSAVNKQGESVLSNQISYHVEIAEQGLLPINIWNIFISFSIILIINNKRKLKK